MVKKHKQIVEDAKFLKAFDEGIQKQYSKTLDESLREVWANEWKHMRSGKCLLSQAEKAIQGLAMAVIAPRPTGWLPEEAIKVVTVREVTSAHVCELTAGWYALGLAPATINKRLNCLSKLGVNVAGHRAKNKPALKWWLKPDDYKMVMDHLASSGQKFHARKHLVKMFIIWTCHTGLRIEESLRLTYKDFQWERGLLDHPVAVTVPGLKTHDAQATLPLGMAATNCIMSLNTDVDIRVDKDNHVFPITYEELKEEWNKLRDFFGWTDSTATLKALRRNAARYLHVDCGMPLDMVRQYLRHEDIETTMGYLKLTGGYGTEEMKRYLK